MANLKGGYVILDLDIRKYNLISGESKRFSINEYPEFKEIFYYLNNSYSIRKPILINIIDKDSGSVTGFGLTNAATLTISSEDGVVLKIMIYDVVNNILAIEYNIY